MKINMTIQVEIDATRWANNNGVAPTAREVREDVKSYLLQRVQHAPLILEVDGEANPK